MRRVKKKRITRRKSTQPQILFHHVGVNVNFYLPAHAWYFFKVWYDRVFSMAEYGRVFSMAEYSVWQSILQSILAWSKVIVFLRPCFDNLARERIGLNLRIGGSPLRLFVVWHCFNCVYIFSFVDLKQERSKNRFAGKHSKQWKKSSVGSPPWRSGKWGPATPSGAALLFLAQYLYDF